MLFRSTVILVSGFVPEAVLPFFIIFLPPKRGCALCAGLSPAFHKKPSFYEKPYPPQEEGAEGFQRASGKPFGRLRRGETLRKTEGERKVFPLPSTRNQFLVGGFVRLRADEVLSITGKYPKGAGGGQRVHGTWPPPDPPLLSYSAPLASQGRAQLGSHPSPGGPLSPSAQLIPPPAPRCRVILGVMARYRHDRNTLQQNVLRLRCQAICVPAPAPDWLLAPGQTK